MVSVVDTEYRDMYISLNNSVEEENTQSRSVTRSCRRFNDANIHTCYNTFITMPNILVLVLRRFDKFT